MEMKAKNFKQLSFSTTLRSPERAKDFLYIISEFEGKILSNEIITEIEINLIRNKKYKPIKSLNNLPHLKEKFENMTLNKEEAKEIVDNIDSKHKEAGFDSGVPSRFATQFMFLVEFGFLYLSIGEKIEISELGKNLSIISDLNDEKPNEFDSLQIEQNIFLNAMLNFQQGNPFRKEIKKTNKISSLLINVVKTLRKKGYKNGIQLDEIPFLLVWPDEDYDSLTDIIIMKRVNKYSEDLIYEECLKIITKATNFEDEASTTRFKYRQLMIEGVDDFIRKFRISGLIILRGNGRFIDINDDILKTIEKDIDYKYKFFSNRREYYDSVSKYKIKSINNVNSNDFDFETWKDKFTIEELIKELEIIKNKKNSQHKVLKYVNRVIRLEFIVSLLLAIKAKDFKIKPNLILDDEGYPVFHASGNKADIEIYNQEGLRSFVEVSLQTGRVQTTNEMLPITRHIEEHGISKAWYISPSGHKDIDDYIEFVKTRGIEIKYNTLDEFIEMIDSENFKLIP